MDVEKLEKQWSKLKKQKSPGFVTIKIDANCMPDLNLGINSKQNRALLLRLPKGVKIDFIGEEKENLKTSYNKHENSIVLELLDHYYFSLFNDLIISLYYKIKDIEDPKKHSIDFINTVNKWAAFLAKGKNNKLTKEVVTGLFGELAVLIEFLKVSNSNEIDPLLKSWQGPYDANTDFVFDNKNIEVKTKNIHSPKVKISSEHQLDDDPGKYLNLAVVSIESDYNSMLTIETMINQIRSHILDLNGDLSVFYEALAQMALYPSILKEYNNYRFTLKQIITYSCDLITPNKEVFPRVTKSKLPQEIEKVKYLINLTELDSFIIDRKTF